MDPQRHLCYECDGTKSAGSSRFDRVELRLRSGVDRAVDRWFTPALLAGRRRLARGPGVRIHVALIGSVGNRVSSRRNVDQVELRVGESHSLTLKSLGAG